jgi:membrane associated rhomboid family serine protease
MNWAIILLTVVAHLVRLRLPQVQSLFELDPGDPRLYCYFTYIFLHGGIGHLASNMLFLYIFGNNVNDRMGHFGYLGFYLGGGVIAGVAHVLAEQSPVIGASGACFAVTGAFLILFPRAHVTVLYFMVLIGVAEIASMWFILAYLALNLLAQFSHILGSPSNVANVAHLGGAAYGIVVCTGLLAVRLLPRDQWDVIALIDRWNRRRQYRDLVASGYNPFGYITPAKTAPNPLSERIQDLRAAIAEAISHGDVPEATKRFMELRAIDPQQVLSRQNQLDMANHLFEQQHHAAAADAYEGFLRTYPKADRLEHVQLMLGLLYARYLNRPDKAGTYLNAALQRLHNDREVELAKSELERIGQLGASGG